MFTELSTASEIIKALGGPTAAGRIVGRSPQSANNWRIANRFPSNTFPILTRALAERGYTAPSSLWRIIERAEAAQ